MILATFGSFLPFTGLVLGALVDPGQRAETGGGEEHREHGRELQEHLKRPLRDLLEARKARCRQRNEVQDHGREGGAAMITSAKAKEIWLPGQAQQHVCSSLITLLRYKRGYIYYK